MSSQPVYEPLTIRGVEFRNRIWVSPMCQYSCLDFSGVPNDWHLVHLGKFSSGGAGLVMAESTAVSPEGRITAEDTGLWNDEQQRAWTRIVEFSHDYGTKIGIQLAHAGRKGSDYQLFAPGCGTTKPESEGGWRTVAPSAVAYPGFDVPEEMDAAAIERVRADFASSVRRAVQAGFDVVELHAAHGYLLHQFLSPLSNFRTDSYGGSLQNRARLLLEVTAEAREIVGDRALLFVRVSGADWNDGGLEIEDMAAVSTWLRDAGVDLIDVSSGGIVDQIFVSVEPGYQVPLAREIKRTTGLPVGAVGLITTPEQAGEVISEGSADAVFMAREFIRDPHLPLTKAREAGISLDYWPRQYLAGKH